MSLLRDFYDIDAEGLAPAFNSTTADPKKGPQPQRQSKRHKDTSVPRVLFCVKGQLDEDRVGSAMCCGNEVDKAERDVERQLNSDGFCTISQEQKMFRTLDLK